MQITNHLRFIFSTIIVLFFIGVIKAESITLSGTVRTEERALRQGKVTARLNISGAGSMEKTTLLNDGGQYFITFDLPGVGETRKVSYSLLAKGMLEGDILTGKISGDIEVLSADNIENRDIILDPQ